MVRESMSIWRAKPVSAAAEVRLHGAIILPNDFISSGTVVVADGKIKALARTREAGSGALEVDTGGIICPGFVDSHNHAAYAVFHRWNPTQLMKSRFDWRQKTRCGVYVVPEPQRHYLDNIKPKFKEFPNADRHLLFYYGQLRGLIGGTTTMVIDAEYDRSIRPMPGFVRDFTDWDTAVEGLLDAGCLMGAERELVRCRLENDQLKLLVHLGEGVDDFSRGELLSLYENKPSLLHRNTSLIHALALDDDDWKLVSRFDAGVIWSPRSNVRLYGQTLDIDKVRSLMNTEGRSLRVALAPDWTVTGSSTLLDELAHVRQHFPSISPADLLHMVTDVPADLLGLATVGRIEVNNHADLLVFGGAPTNRDEAAECVVGSGLDNLRLVMVGGLGTYGNERLMSASGPQAGPEAEPLKVPYKNAPLERVLRFDSGCKSFKKMRKRLKKGLEQTIAPLWEPD